MPNFVDFSTENVDIIDVYQWNIISSDGAIINGPNESSFNINLEPGVYDVQLVTETNAGCIKTYDESQFITVNNYEAEIAAVPLSICFDGSESVTQAFSASIIADVSDLPYNVISYSWDILSSNSTFCNRDRYRFLKCVL